MTSFFAAGEAIPGVEVLSQYGIAGVIGSIFLWFGWQVYKRERDRADANEAKIEKLNEVIREQYIPSQEATKVALLETNQLLAEFRAKRRS